MRPPLLVVLETFLWFAGLGLAAFLVAGGAYIAITSGRYRDPRP
jgi:hypothetical protein